MIKLLAYHLPQFHEIDENNAWWGKGFTEWTNVQKAKPLYLGHKQPRIPSQRNYYDLANPETLVWQMQLAKKYGIYGFCFYHYWFGEGRVLLDKPLENILITPKADLPFCISWANENWVKTWHGSGGGNRLLIRQKYGDVLEWTVHIEWLIRFFRDPRYIKKDNKPVMLIYNINQIPHREKMLDLWNEQVKKAGFDGIWLVAMKKDDRDRVKCSGVDATVSFEPRRTRQSTKRFKSQWCQYKLRNGERLSNIPVLNRFLYTTFSYDKINQIILNREHKKNEYRGVFTNYDETPRRKEWSLVFKGSTPTKFQYFLEKNIEKSLHENNEFLFINAWNEWGEGAYLEPDEQYGLSYLKAVKRALRNVKKRREKNDEE